MIDSKARQFHDGVIVFVREDGNHSFGFIEPAGSDGSKEHHVWFSFSAMQGAQAEKGDEVQYTLKATQDPYKTNLAAWKVWVRKKAIGGRAYT